MTNDDLRREQILSSGKPWLPAVLLILLQMANGLRDLPQLTFFVIYLQDQLHLEPVVISSLVSGAQIAGMLTALLSGAIVDRLGSQRAMVGGLVIGCLSSLAFQAPTPWLAALLWWTGGAGLALVSVSGASYLTRISKQGGIGMLAAFYALSMTTGGAVGNPLAGVLIERFGFTVFSWTAISFLGLSIFLSLWLTTILKEHNPANPSARGFRLGIPAAVPRAKLLLLVGQRALPTIFYGTLMLLVPLLLNQLTNSKVLVAAYGTTNLVVASIAQLVTGRAADRWGARRPTLVAYAVLICSGIGLFTQAGSVWGLYLFGVMGISAAWALATLLYIWVNDGIPKAGHPAIFGLLHAVWSLSMITGSMVGGWFAASLPGVPFLIGGLINIGSLFLITAYYRGVGTPKEQVYFN